MQAAASNIEDFNPDVPYKLDRNLALEMVRVTEAAAVACSKWIGMGDSDAADQAAVDAMRTALNSIDVTGTVVIGEGERDQAPMLYIGEKVGLGSGPVVDIALDPLEGTSICAKAAPNALAVVAMAEEGGFLNAPDVYMDKIAVGPGLPEGVIALENSTEANLKNVAKAKGVDVSDLLVVVLERDRHSKLVADLRQAGARVQLIGDGDVAGIIAATRPETGVDMYMGIGGAPEGVLAAAALACVGGQMQGRLIFEQSGEGDQTIDDAQKENARRMGITDLNRVYTRKELARGDVMFSATGVTSGWMLDGVRRYPGGATTHSLVTRTRTGTARFVHTEHNFRIKKEV